MVAKQAKLALKRLHDIMHTEDNHACSSCRSLFWSIHKLKSEIVYKKVKNCYNQA